MDGPWFSMVLGMVSFRAEAASDLYHQAQSLQSESVQDIDFLIANGADCSKYFSRFESYLTSAKEKIATEFSDTSASAGSYLADLQSVDKMLATKVPFPAFGTADQNLVKAFAADPNYPNCVAENPTDANRPLKAKPIKTSRQN